MSRLYLIIVCSFLVCSELLGQNLLSKYLKAADEKQKKGDYYYALDLYAKAMEIDSNTIEILWNVAQTYRAYKDYKQAVYYYAKVFDREMADIYPESLLQLALMQKQNGLYTQAIETFKKAKKKYARKKQYATFYNKAKRELESCLWAKSMINSTEKGEFDRLPEQINTKNAEFGHLFIDEKFIFSSLRADSISENEEVYQSDYSTQLFYSNFENGEFSPAKRWDEFASSNYHVGNATRSIDGKRLYFSACQTGEDFSYTCKILVAKWHDHSWQLIDTLGEIINAPQANTTMPAIGQLNGQEVLFFCSNRTETQGGLDIFYSPIKNGNQYGKPIALRSLNSVENDVTPFWDDDQQRLYFSSSWHDGFGGLDIFYSAYENGQFQEPINAGLPINSPANDLYFFQQNDTSYFTSNRVGVLYSKNPTCCSDIFTFIPPKKQEDILTPTETLEELNQRLPITLYFHNDIPNPRSWDTTTTLDYLTTYREYTDMLPRYQKEYASGLSSIKAQEAQEDIEDFFIEHVDQGVKNLALFRTLLLEELHKGVQIKIAVQGFASPLAQTDYNVNLTKRRIASLINHLKQYENGVFMPYISGTASNGGHIVFEQIPFGEYNANQLISDNPNDKKNSIYSRVAAAERKIEIQSVSYLEQKIAPITIIPPIFDAGNNKAGDRIMATFKLTNYSDAPVILLPEQLTNEHLLIRLNASQIEPNQTVTIQIEMDTKHLVGTHQVQTIAIPVQGYDEPIRLMITTELK